MKTAEVDVQKAAQLSLAELENLSRAQSPGASLPVRPLWGLELLRNAVAAHADAAGVSPSHESATAAPRDALPAPSLLEIDAAPDATVKLWGNALDLQLVALDARGVSYMHLQPDNTTRARLPRRGSLRGAVLQDGAGRLVWSTAPDKCGATRCGEKSTGLAPLPVPLTKLPEPRWIAAHPFGSPQRSIAWHGARTWLAAAQLDGTARLVEFADLPAAADPEAPPIEPTATLTRAARELVVFTESTGALGALALEHAADGRLHLVHYRESERARPILPLAAAFEAAWLRTCRATGEDGADTRYFVIGSEDQVLFGSIRDGVATTWPLLDAAIPAPVRTDRAPEVAIACSAAGGITAAFLEAGALESVTCARGQEVCLARTLTDLATSVDLAHTSDGMLVAYSGAPEHPQVRVRQLDLRGEPGEETVPGPCWERWGGMCGEPALAWAGPRLVLAARSGASAMALESPDAGRTWTPLSANNLLKPPGPHVLPRAAVR